MIREHGMQHSITGFYPRPMVQLLADNWQESPIYDSQHWTAEEAMEWLAEYDSNPAPTWEGICVHMYTCHVVESTPFADAILHERDQYMRMLNTRPCKHC